VRAEPTAEPETDPRLRQIIQECGAKEASVYVNWALASVTCVMEGLENKLRLDSARLDGHPNEHAIKQSLARVWSVLETHARMQRSKLEQPEQLERKSAATNRILDEVNEEIAAERDSGTHRCRRGRQ
jgi:hypothetical protein